MFRQFAQERPWAQEAIENMERDVQRYLNKEIDGDAFRKVRLRNGFYMQRQNEEYMQRIKLPYGEVNTRQFRAIADVNEQYSHGIAHVTTRQDIQLHYVKISNAGKIMRRLAQDGVTSREGCADTVRNINGSPWAGLCRHEEFDFRPAAHALFEFCLYHPETQALPRKFKPHFACCLEHSDQIPINDLGFLAVAKEGPNGKEYGFRMYVGGGLGAIPHASRLLRDFVPCNDIIPASLAVIRVYNQHGDRENRKKNRIKFLVQKIGINEFKRLWKAEFEKIQADRQGHKIPDVDMTPGLHGGPRNGAANKPGGALPAGFDEWWEHCVEPTREDNTVIVHIPLYRGDMTSPEMRAIADAVDKSGDGMIRTVYTQNLLVPGMKPENTVGFYEAMKAAGLIRNHLRTARDVVTCPGLSTCSLAVGESRTVAQLIDEELAKHGDLVRKVGTLRINVSGCPNSCGQHHIADIGLIGSQRKVGGEMIEHYQFLLGGVTDERRMRLGVNLMTKVPTAEVAHAVVRLLKAYLDSRQADESFGHWSIRTPNAQLRAILQY
ncbi:MAG: Sulfite reductase [ferredoxin] [Myxococcota bacterium]|nr:Sulfite reductase [ferredoxin] [Myxococcota bacterium]